jgi:transcriptional regulator with XRE-family HTH domain
MSTIIDALHGQKLTWLRLKSGNPTQEAIAKALGISQQDYSDYEHGKRPFREEFVQRVCKHYNMEPADFYTPNNGVIMGNNNAYAGNNFSQNDLKLLDALKETFQIALKAKDETIELQKEIIAGLRKGK